MTKLTKKTSYYRINKISVRILGVKVDFVDLQEALSLVGKWVKSSKKYQITTPNPEQIILAQKDYRFREILNKSALAIADGVGLVAAARLLKFKVKSLKFKVIAARLKRSATIYQRLSGIDLMIELCKLAAKKNWRVFLLGGRNNVAQKTAAAINNLTIKQFNNRLKIEYFEGAKNIKEESEREKKEAVRRINNFKPDILFVAYGAPWQEKWIGDNLPQLKVKVAMGVGGAFDYLAGKVKRAPFWIRKIGLEWFWRLLNQPWRLRRQLALIKFVYLVIRERFN